MKYYTDGMARPFSCIEHDGEPIVPGPGDPELFVPIYKTREACIAQTGVLEPIEWDLKIEGVVQ